MLKDFISDLSYKLRLFVIWKECDGIERNFSFFLWNECVSLEEKKKRENGWIVPWIHTSVEIVTGVRVFYLFLRTLYRKSVFDMHTFTCFNTGSIGRHMYIHNVYSSNGTLI